MFLLLILLSFLSYLLNLTARAYYLNFFRFHAHKIYKEIDKNYAYELTLNKLYKSFIFASCKDKIKYCIDEFFTFLIFINTIVLLYTLFNTIFSEIGSLCVVFITLIILNIINFTKFNILKEVLVVSDFNLLKEIILKPNFYFSYLNKKHILGILILIFSFILFLLSFNEDRDKTITSFYYILIILSFLNIFYLKIRYFKNFDILNKNCIFYVYKNSFRTNLLSRDHFYYNALIDAIKYGTLLNFILTLILFIFYKKSYLKHVKRLSFIESEKDLIDFKIKRKNKDKSNFIFLYQFESFCNILRFNKENKAFNNEFTQCLFKELNHKYISKEQDKGLNNLSCKDYILDVNCVGAYTMRTEFEILTNLNLDNLGIYSYDPYMLFNSITLHSIVTSLKANNFKCICIHANSKKFFNRDKVFKKIGFDEFLDINYLKSLHLSNAKSYTKDSVILDFINEQLLNKEYKNLFIFFIGIETHGPFSDVNDYTTRLIDILTHLNNFILHNNRLEKYEHRSFFIYGDHIPYLNDLIKKDTYLKPDAFYIGTNVTITKESLIKANTFSQLIKDEIYA